MTTPQQQPPIAAPAALGKLVDQTGEDGKE
jgi:hypothetical protein